MTVMLNTQQRAEEFGVGDTDVCLLTTTKWQHHGAPSHFDGRAKEFKKSSSSRRAQHDPLLQGCGMFIYPSAGGRVK